MSTPDTVEQIRYHAECILALLPPPAPETPLITTPEELDAALATCAEGAVLLLANTLVYPRPLSLDTGVTLQGESYAGASGRMTRDAPAPRFDGGITALVDHHALRGLDLRGTATVGTMGGAHVVWDRCRLLGDPMLGAHRGIQWCGTDGRITRCYIDQIFRPDQDTQAICAWDCGPGLLIDDCWLCAAGESVMFGGADASTADRMPREIVLAHSTLTSNPAWYDSGMQIKTALEFKACADVEVYDCVLEWPGVAQGHGAYLIVATVRNQDGAAPWSTITNVTVRNCTGGHASGVCSILGTDNVHPSGVMDGFTLRDCTFEDITWANPAGRVFMVDGAPVHLTLDGVTVTGDNLSQLGYFSGPPPIAMVLARMALPPSEYGWYVDAVGSGRDVLQAYAPDAQLDDTIM